MRLGDVYAFISSLYFRGKRTYALRFAGASSSTGVWVITPTRGLVPVDAPVTLADLSEFAACSIEPGAVAYRSALLRTARDLDAELEPGCEVILLGSIASGRYVEPLLEALGPRLSVPETFAGRGDMSRGGLLLRCVAADEELVYVPATTAIRHGARPPRLDPKTRPRV